MPYMTVNNKQVLVDEQGFPADRISRFRTWLARALHRLSVRVMVDAIDPELTWAQMLKEEQERLERTHLRVVE